MGAGEIGLQLDRAGVMTHGGIVAPQPGIRRAQYVLERRRARKARRKRLAAADRRLELPLAVQRDQGVDILLTGFGGFGCLIQAGASLS